MRRWLRLPKLLVALLALVALLVLAALVAATCVGDDDGAAGGDQAAPAAMATATETATPQQTAAPQQTATASQPSQAPRSVTEIESFRYTLTMKVSGELAAGGILPGATGTSGDVSFGIESTGEVIAPDREHTTLTAKLGFIEIANETIRVGDRVWVREQDGPWREQAGEADLDFGAFLDPVDLIGPGGDAAGLAALLAMFGAGTAERVNGVDAVKYELSETQFAQAFGDGVDDDLLGEGDLGQLDQLTITVWVATDLGVPVRVLMEGAADDAGAEGSFSMQIDIFDINSDDIVIEPPA